MSKKQLEITDFPLITRIPVQWNDMDAAAHVNNLVYLRWCETSRVEYFERMKMNIAFRGAGTGPILSYQDGKYIFPMTYPDVAIIGTRTLEVLEDRFILQAAVFSEKYERIAAISTQVIVPYDYEKLSKVVLPGEWVKAITEIEAN